MSGFKAPLRVACLGAGYFAQFHHDGWRRIGEVELVGACDRDREKASATGVPVFSDLEGMLAGATPDILDIIVPPPGHFEAIKVAVEAGVPVIICQKPFCQSPEEAARAVELAEQSGVTLVVHENFRFQPWYRTIREALETGRIGEVLQITFRLRPGDGQGPGAYLDRQPYFQSMERFLVHETAVHWIDTFRYLMGEPEAVFADLRRINPVIAGEDAGYVLFYYADGRRAVFDGNRHLDHAAENHRLTMGEALAEGTEGSLSLSGNGAVELRRFGEVEVETLLEARDWAGFGGDCVWALQAHVVAHLLSGTPLENRAEEYLRVIEIEEAIYRSAELQCRVALEP